MKSTVVPAQITTVEDKIAGSLTFAQILLLVFFLIIGTAFYGLIPPRLHLSTLKIVLMIAQFAVFGLLALRYKGRILAEWLIVYLRYRARPRIYVFTKNDLRSREELTNTMPTSADKQLAKAKIRKKTGRDTAENYPVFNNPGSIISIKPSKKGGLDVEYTEA